MISLKHPAHPLSWLAVVLMAAPCGAEEPSAETEMQQIVEFLKDHVMERTFVLGKTTVLIDNDRIEAVGEVSVMFTNLAETRRGWQCDRFDDRVQANFHLDAEGKRTGEQFEHNARSLTRCSFSERKSTGRVLGYTSCIATDGDWYYSARTLQLRMKGKDLVLIESGTLYNDSFAKTGRRDTGLVVTVNTFSREDDGVKMVYREQSYAVDPESLDEAPETPWKMKLTAKKPLPEMIFWSKDVAPKGEST